MVALLQGAEGALAHVLMLVSTEQVVKHSLAQRAFGVAHALQRQGVGDGFHDRQAGRENTSAVGFDPGQIQFVDFTQFQHFALEPGQPGRVDPAVALPGFLEHQADGANGARGAQGFLPAEAAQGVLDAHQL